MIIVKTEEDYNYDYDQSYDDTDYYNPVINTIKRILTEESDYQ